MQVKPAEQPLTRRELRERSSRSSDVRLRGHAAHAGSDLQPARRARNATIKRVEHRPLAVVAKTRPSLRRRVAQHLFSAGAFVFAAALAVGLTVPANAFVSPMDTAAEPTALAPSDGAPLQSMEVVTEAEAITAGARDGYSVTSYKAKLQERYGSSFTYATNWSGEVRWPFPYPVPVSSDYGYRVAPCAGCSTNHDGIDFTPGYGKPIYAIANGVVTTHSESGGLGNHVMLTHIIDGKLVESVYAHMQYGSSPLVPGQEVKAGDLVGLVGSSGQSTGPHLHLELFVEGVNINPLPWLQQNAS